MELVYTANAIAENQKMHRKSSLLCVGMAVLGACRPASDAGGAANAQAAKVQADAARIDAILDTGARQRGLRRLSEQELRKLLPGRQIIWRSYAPGIFRMSFHRDGRWTAESSGGVAPNTRYGTYRFVGNKFCGQDENPDSQISSIGQCYALFTDSISSQFIVQITPFNGKNYSIAVDIREF